MHNAIGIKKSRIYYALTVLLLINIGIFIYIYFHYLKEIHQQPILSEILVQEPVPQPPANIVRVVSNQSRVFAIDYKNDVFLKDGKPFHYISGSFHYFRVPRVYWRNRLRKYRAAGLNVVCTYVEWSSHEPSPRNYQFSGDNDIEYFLQLAVEEGLLVILRPGPYICAERDFGGLPPWLLTLYPGINLRTNDTDYENEVQRWFNVLFKRLQKYLYGNGGPIIMVQVENEYGSFPACNLEHRLWLRNEIRKHVQETAVLFTTDGNYESYLKCGSIPEVYATIDFGASANVTKSFIAMRQYSPQGPLVNSEFYPGWLSHWDEPMEKVETSEIINMMKEMLDLRVNFNFYMFFGGTNFGFKNGANNGNDFQPQLTSYDYDAPLDEAGDPTPKYYEIQNLISKYYKLPDIPLLKPAPKGNYGKVQLQAVLSIFNLSYVEDGVTLTAHQPKTFEQMNVKYGYMLYETTLPNNISDPAVLSVPEVRDRAIVYIDHKPAGILSRRHHIYSIPLLAPPGRTLSLLVENQGRINFGPYLKDMKGILSPPLLNGYPLFEWKMTGLPFEKISWLYKLHSHTNKISPPALYVGELVLPWQKEPLDTYVDLTGWGKGVIFVNDFNLGRYWPSIGSQVTLYVPGSYLKAGPNVNKIVVFETEYVPGNREIVFTDKPNLNKIPPSVVRAFSDF